jgi:hypothetical protein
MINNPKNLKIFLKSVKSKIFMNLKVQKSPFSLWNLRNLKIAENSDVTFRSNTFSYKKLFYPTSYAKVIAVLLLHNIFLQNITNLSF